MSARPDSSQRKSSDEQKQTSAGVLVARIALRRWSHVYAVRIISPSNTTAEMQRKREELFAAGTRLVWMVDLSTRSVRIYRDPNRFQELTETDELDGEDVLPGFTLSIQELFATLN